jgi:hypothetical protein
MQPLRARVRRGRLVLDEPTDLPEGQVVDLVPVSASVGRRDDGFTEVERQALLGALDEGIVAARAGDYVEAADFVQELLARK